MSRNIIWGFLALMLSSLFISEHLCTLVGESDTKEKFIVAESFPAMYVMSYSNLDMFVVFVSIFFPMKCSIPFDVRNER